MISRIYVLPARNATRNVAGGPKNEGTKENTSGNAYIIDSRLSKKELTKLAQALTNPILEKYFINESPQVGNFSRHGGQAYAIEIGFLPGVTDNVGHTIKETAIDLLHLKESSNFHVYTSKIFLISGFKKMNEIEKIANTLYNPLIERANIIQIKSGKMNLLLKAPEVILQKHIPVIDIPLSVSDEELAKISKFGIEEGGKHRGPLALDLSSMKAIQAHFVKLKRNPTDIELETFAQTWSEHCKHTIFANPIDNIKDGLYKTYIKGATNLIRKRKGKKLAPSKGGDFCVSVFSDNAGGIIFDDNFLIAHKVETHNSPSALDPFGGAITGIGGVNRDIIGFGLGAKPVANTYGFCFGEPEDKRELFLDKNLKQRMLPPRRIMEGVIKGINAGGNTSGIPTISGFIKFDDRFRGKPLVFAGTIGLIPRNLPTSRGNKRLSHKKQARAGDYIVMVGGRVGLDGIHGATFSSVGTDSNSPATAVQIGDPITQKKLSDAIIKEARDLNLYNSITDNGAGGLSSSVGEMAKESGGAKVFLGKVPLKYPGLRPWEIWISESQERMTLSIPKNKWKKFNKIMQSRGAEASIIGKFTKSGKIIAKWKGKKVMDLSMDFLHNGLPQHYLRTEKIIPPPFSSPYGRGRLGKGKVYNKDLENLLKFKNISGFSFISEQYDHEVQASSVLKPLLGRGRINTDAQIFKPVLSSNKGVVLSSATYPSYGDISTYHMAACAIDTAIRNTICAGGTLSHLAILDNFCWCSSNDPKRLAQLVDAVRACYDYSTGYGTPFISGKDSMFNDFNGYDEQGNPVAISIPPTLLISSISVMQDLYKTVSPEFKNEGDLIYLLGETHNELGASEYFKMLGAIGNNVPKVNLKENLKTYLALEKVIQKELVASAISLNSGGLAIALAKASVGGMLGCDVSLSSLGKSLGKSLGIDAKLFSESQGRVLVSVSPKNITKFEKMMQKISYAKLGKVTKNGKVIVTESKNKIIDTTVKNLYTAYHSFSNSMK